MKSKDKNKKKIIVAALLLLLLCCLKESKGSSVGEGGIRRNEPGEGERQQVLEAEAGGKTYEIEVKIDERQFTKKEAEEKIEAAKKEIDQSFLGKNKSLNRIDRPVVVKESYQDGAVEAEWSLGENEILDREGNFIKMKLPEEGKILLASVFLTCGEVKEEYQFSFHAYSPVRSMKEKIEDALAKENEKSRTKKELPLPEEIEGENIRWKEPPSHTILILLLLGAVSGVLLKLRGLEEERKKQKKREQELLFAYPQIVNTLSLLIGAGMSVPKAWERLAVYYKSRKQERKNAAYEELCYTWNEIRDGVGEREAYRNFGRRCKLPQYKKLASLLEQNSRKGTAGIAQMLAEEAETALHQRRNLAKKLGEEAGTKLLLPMMMMLAIVMVIVLMPALFAN